MKTDTRTIASFAAAAVLALGGTALAQQAPSGTGITPKPGGIGLAAPGATRIADAGATGSARFSIGSTHSPDTGNLGAGRTDLLGSGSLRALPRASGYGMGMGMPAAAAARMQSARPDRD